MRMRSRNRKHDFEFLFKYLSAETAIAVLNSQSLRHSSPLMFNDPFDVPREWRGFTVHELEEAVVEQFSAYLRGDEPPRNTSALKLLEAYQRSGRGDPEQFLQEVRFFFRLMVPTLAGHLAAFEAAYQELVPGKRILCFTEDATSPTMWAHYGDSHSGVVLQFETSDSRDSVWLMAQPVIYQDSKPRVPDANEWVRSMMAETPVDWDAYFREFYFVKHSDWSYEREVRVVSAKKGTETGLFADYVFHPEDLRGVILGARIHENLERIIRGLVRIKYPHAILSRARIDHDGRRIAIEPAL